VQARPVDEGNKLGEELTTVRNNCKVMSEMLTEMKPGQDSAADIELLEASTGNYVIQTPLMMLLHLEQCLT